MVGDSETFYGDGTLQSIADGMKDSKPFCQTVVNGLRKARLRDQEITLEGFVCKEFGDIDWMVRGVSHEEKHAYEGEKANSHDMEYRSAHPGYLKWFEAPIYPASSLQGLSNVRMKYFKKAIPVSVGKKSYDFFPVFGFASVSDDDSVSLALMQQTKNINDNAKHTEPHLVEIDSETDQTKILERIVTQLEIPGFTNSCILSYESQSDGLFSGVYSDMSQPDRGNSMALFMMAQLLNKSIFFEGYKMLSSSSLDKNHGGIYSVVFGNEEDDSTIGIRFFDGHHKSIFISENGDAFKFFAQSYTSSLLEEELVFRLSTLTSKEPVRA